MIRTHAQQRLFDVHADSFIESPSLERDTGCSPINRSLAVHGEALPVDEAGRFDRAFHDEPSPIR